MIELSKPTLWVTLMTLTAEKTFAAPAAAAPLVFSAAEHFHPVPSFFCASCDGCCCL